MFVLIALGEIISTATLLFVLQSLVLLIRVEWTCNQCGKHRESNIFEYAVQWCDHEGDW